MIINNIDVNRLATELVDAGVNLEKHPEYDAEEYGNYIIHQYNIHFLPVHANNYKQEQEIAKIVHSVRKFRGQQWK